MNEKEAYQAGFNWANNETRIRGWNFAIMEQKPNKIIWHHLGCGCLEQSAKIVNVHHETLGFPLSYLEQHGGYHKGIYRDGDVHVFRHDEEIGMHDRGENVNSLGLVFMSDFNLYEPTVEMEIAAAHEIDKWIQKWHIPTQRLEPHRWGDITDCPGKLVDDYWLQRIYLKHKINWLKRLLLWLQKRTP